MGKQKTTSAFLAMLLASGLFPATAGAKDTPCILDNASATISNPGTRTQYNASNDLISDFSSGANASYMVGDTSNGIFDVYLEISKTRDYSSGSTPLSISVNEGPATVPIIEPAASKRPYSDAYDKGVFLCLEHVALKAGDTITVTALPGFSYNAPGIGDILLYRHGEKVAVGYDGGAFPEYEPADPQDPLSGLQLVWLGSSVTHGVMADGYSMADYLEENHNRLESYKYAVSGTTLADTGKDVPNPASYVSRMKQIPAEGHPDFFIVQLSTNDATSKPAKPIGTFVDSRNLDDFDTGTVYGAIQYIIVYASRTWNCPVVFFTGTRNQYPAYAAMRDALLDIRAKWGIGVIDLFKDLDIDDPGYGKYMKDALHPTADGYRSWWGPVFERYLTSFVTGVPLE